MTTNIRDWKMNTMKMLRSLFTNIGKDLEAKDPRLPIKAIAGLYNVKPWNCETTQVQTSNWPHGSGCFFFELKGCWHDIPPLEVIVLSGDGEVNQTTGNFRPLYPTEQIKGLQFMRDNWPKSGADPHVNIVKTMRRSGRSET